MLSVSKSARVRPIRTGDDYDTERVKEFKQKVKKTTKVTIEPSSMIYVTTLNSRQIRRRHNSQSTPVPDRKSEESKTQTSILLEPIQESMKNVEELEEPSVNKKSSLNYQKLQKLSIQCKKKTAYLPDSQGMIHKEKLKGRRIAKPRSY